MTTKGKRKPASRKTLHPVSYTPKRRRLMAVGCSHGALIDPIAEEACYKFRDRWKPDDVVHLGDFIDTGIWRGGASAGIGIEVDAEKDVEAGFRFLRQLGATHLCMGNHDERPYRYLEDRDPIKRMAAERAVLGMEYDLQKLGVTVLKRYAVHDYLEFGPAKAAHGWYYNENCARDHAESHGTIIFAHAHTTMMMKGRRIDNPTGFCVGTLSRVPAHNYAKGRRKTLSWAQGILWAEYNDKEFTGWIHENGQNLTGQPWHLPI